MNQKDLPTMLRRHFALYPGMEMEDVVKLLYQSEFGGGHLLEDSALFCQRLQEEMAPLDTARRPPVLVEEIGGGYSRVHLFGLPEGLLAETFTKLCVLSAEQPRGSRVGLLENLRQVREMIAKGELPLSAEKWNTFLELYSKEGCPPLRHSPRYKGLYTPHYRVLDSLAASLLPVFALADSTLAQKAQVLLGIDGMAAAGKSGLSALLQKVYACNVIHTDDFFLQTYQRTLGRLEEAGGNVDYERLAPVAKAASTGQPLCYQHFNCQTGQLENENCDIPTPLTVLEGAYALHPKIAAPCDVRVFLMLNAAVQARRIEARNSPVLATRFTEEWIPMENRYFSAFSIRESCDITVDTTGWPPLP